MLSIKLVKKHKYYIFLLLIGVILSVFYYFNTNTYAPIFQHYYEYYSRSLVIDYYLKQLDFKATLLTYLNSYIDKIIIFRTVPFFLIFGPSHFLFSYSNFFYNYLLLIFLFYALTKIMDIKKAFLFTLFILSNSFFLEYLNFFYFDLNYFLTCSIFFVYLSIFKDNYKKHNILLVFLAFLLFLTNNKSYPLLSLLSFFMGLYFFLTKKKERYTYTLRFFLIILFGFLIYFFIAFGYDKDLLYGELMAVGNPSFGIFFNFLNKFPNTVLIFALYSLVLYNIFQKRNLFFIYLFFFSEFFLFLLSLFYRLPLRYFFPFYLIYLFFFFDFIYDSAKRFFKKKHNSILFILILLFFIYNFFNYYFYDKKNYINFLSSDHALNDILYYLDSNYNQSKVFVHNGGVDAFSFQPISVSYESSFTYFTYTYFDNFSSNLYLKEPAWFFLRESDPAHRHLILDFYELTTEQNEYGVSKIEDFNYVICIDCSSLNLTNFDLDFKYFYKESERFYKSYIVEYIVSVYKNKNFNSTKENI